MQAVAHYGKIFSLGKFVIGGNIFHHDRLVAKRRGTARPPIGANLPAIQDLEILLWKARPGRYVKEAPVLLVQQHDGTKRSRRNAYYRQGQSIQDFVQRRALRHQLQHPALFFDDERRVSQIQLVPHAGGQATSCPEPGDCGENGPGREHSGGDELKPHGLCPWLPMAENGKASLVFPVHPVTSAKSVQNSSSGPNLIAATKKRHG